MSQPLLEIRDLTLSWDGKPVCERLSFDVARGELVCLVGRSGTGKTTLFHAIAGLTTPDSGCILLDGDEVTGKPGKVSYMLQKDLLLPEHTIIDNISMPLVIRGMRRRDAREKAAAHFKTFGIDGTERLYPNQLSGGMRQRAALLRTYMMKSEFILADEPFSALDAFTRTDMQTWFLEMLTELQLSAILVTHDVDEAVAMADRIVVLAGNPAQGCPSVVAGIVDVDAPRVSRKQFILTDAALDLKRKVLELLS